MAVVLIVEDDPLVRMMTAELLQDANLIVEEAATADEALRLLSAAAGNVDVVVTDIRMPGRIDGLDLAAWLVTERPDVRVIVMSGYAENVRARLPPGVELLAKPWSGEVLVNLVKGSQGL